MKFRSLYTTDVEAVKFLMLPLPAPLEVLRFRVRFRTFGIFCFRLRVELVASSLFYQSAFASIKM